MKFNSYTTNYEYDKTLGKYPKAMSSEEYFVYIRNNIGNPDKHLSILRTLWMERQWHRGVRPYYKVWPAIHEAFLKVPLNLCIRELAVPVGRTVAIRIVGGMEYPMTIDGEGVIMVGSMLVSTWPHDNEGTLGGISVAGQAVQPSVVTRRPMNLRPVTFRPSGTDTVESQLGEYRYTEEGVAVALVPIIRLAIGVLLMANDPSIITADVLSKDRRKYEETSDQKYIDKARKRGVVGWSIGEKYETCPHYRRPHLGIRHTGKGGKIPRIVPIKGAVVHNKKLTTVPTGYITPSGVEVESKCQ